MAPDKDLMEHTATRLRAVMQDMELKTVDDLAAILGVGRARVSNWLNAYHLAPVDSMIELCEQTGLTLDWIYRGKSDGLTYAASIRLAARLAGIEPADAQEEPPAPSPPESSPKGKGTLRGKPAMTSAKPASVREVEAVGARAPKGPGGAPSRRTRNLSAAN